MAHDPLLEQIRSGNFGFADDFQPAAKKEEDFVWEEEEREIVQTIDFLAFPVENLSVLLPLGYIETVLPLPKLTPYPGGSKLLAGGFQFANQVYPAIDLHQLTIGEPMELSDTLRPKIALLRHADRQIGLIVQQLRRSVRLEMSQIATLPQTTQESLQAANASVFEGVARLHGEAQYIYSVSAILQQLDRQQDL